MIEAKTGVMQVQAKQHQGLMATARSQGKAGKDSTWNLRGEHGPTNTFISDV